MSKQVQLRGGTSEEHASFTGAEREVTIDTTLNTVRVHDGKTVGGHILAKKDELDKVDTDINNRIDDMQNNLGGSHNHDDRYAKLNHSHSNYIEKVSGLSNLFTKLVNTYPGLTTETGNDTDWIRVSKNGLLPYQAGGYSSIGTDSWRFNIGYFNNINTKYLVVAKNGADSTIEFPAVSNDPGYIKHIESPADTSSLRFSVSDNRGDSDRFQFGSTSGGSFNMCAYLTSAGTLRIDGGLNTGSKTLTMNGVYIYFDGQRPSSAPDGSISFG